VRVRGAGPDLVGVPPAFIYQIRIARIHNAADDHTKAVFDKSIRWKTDQFILMFRKPQLSAARVRK
jgi:hypothetical protein